jgi:hypothetical protein
MIMRHQLCYCAIRVLSNLEGSTSFVWRNTGLHRSRTSRAHEPGHMASEGSRRVIEIARPGKQNDALSTQEHGHVKTACAADRMDTVF